MSKFILFAVAMLVQGCNKIYDSINDAEQACKAWQKTGIIHNYTINQADGHKEIEQYSRLCDLEKEAEQVVGYESETVGKANSWSLEKRIKFRGNGDYRKTKYFKYTM